MSTSRKTTTNNSAKAEITTVKTNSYVERVMSKLKEGPEATVAKYAKDVVKFHEEQIKLANAEIEELETRLEEKEEEIQDLAEAIDLQAIKSIDSRKSYIESKARLVNAKFVEVDAIKAKIKEAHKQIANHNRLLAVYA